MLKKFLSLVVLLVLIFPANAFASVGLDLNLRYFEVDAQGEIIKPFSGPALQLDTNQPFRVKFPNGDEHVATGSEPNSRVNGKISAPYRVYYPNADNNGLCLSVTYHFALWNSDQPVGTYSILSYPVPKGYEVVRTDDLSFRFAYSSDDPDYAQRFLDRHPNVCFDLTAGIEMYENFSKDPVFWREFFTKNADRLIFGTDSTDSQPTDQDEMPLDQHNEMELRFLREADVFAHYDMEIHGLGLPKKALEKILYKNFTVYAGEKPKQMNIQALLEEGELLRGYLKDKIETERFDRLIAEIAKSN